MTCFAKRWDLICKELAYPPEMMATVVDMDIDLLFNWSTIYYQSMKGQSHSQPVRKTRRDTKDRANKYTRQIEEQMNKEY